MVKISEILDFGENFRKKFQKFRKIDFVKFSKNFDFGQIFENFDFSKKNRKISILVKFSKNLDVFQFRKISILVKIFEKFWFLFKIFFEKISVKFPKFFGNWQNFDFIWKISKNFDFGFKIFEKFDFIKFSKQLDFGQNFEKFDFSEIFEDFHIGHNLRKIFFRKFRKISILVKFSKYFVPGQNFEKSRF